MSPTEVELGEQVTLSGSGFIVGDALLELDGILSAPGQSRPDNEVHLSVEALATSTRRATARIPRRRVDMLGASHSTFSGRATLRFDSAAGPHAPTVVATLDSVRLELFSSQVTHQNDAHRAHQRGQQVLDELGLTASVLPEGRGIIIERTLSGRPGAHAGLRPGEVIVASGNVTVASFGDLTPPPRSNRITLGVRGVDGQFRRVACPLQQPGRSPDGDRIAALSIAGCALLLLLITAGPLRGPALWLGAHLSRGAIGPRELSRQLTLLSHRSPARAMLTLLLFTLAPFLVLAVADAGVVLVAGLVVLVAAAAGAASRRGWRRGPAALGGLLRSLPIVAIAAIGALRAASIDLGAIVAAQDAAPWRWIAVTDPGSLLLVLIAGTVACADGQHRPSPATALLRGLAGALVVATALGGWAISDEHALWGQLLFASKSWIVGLALAQGGRCRLVLALPLAALCLGASVALSILPLPEWVPAAVRWAATSATGLLVAPLLLKIALTTADDTQVTEDPWVEENPRPERRFRPAPGHA